MISKIILDKFEIDYDNQFVSFPKIQLSRDIYPIKIIGQNGCGKSSLILSLAGVIPDYIFGRPSIKFKLILDNEMSCFPENQVYFRVIPQKFKYGILGFYPYEEVLLVNSIDEDWKAKVINELEINNLNNISSNYLSDGEKKRLMICKSLSAFPPLIISDEWTTHLDNYWINKIQLLFDEYFIKGGFHLEFHSDYYSNDSNVLIKTKQTNSDYLRENFVDLSFLKNVLESSLNLLEFSTHRKVSYYGDNINKMIDLHITSGQLIQLTGKNGAGKTTLLKNLWKDSFYLYKRIIKKVTKKPRILYIPSDPSYHTIGPTIKNEFEKIIGSKFHNEAKLFFENLIGVRVNKDVLGLSNGQRKLLAISLGLFSTYPLICIDEAFSGLDKSNQKIVTEMFNIAVSLGKTIIFTSQENRNISNTISYQV